MLSSSSVRLHRPRPFGRARFRPGFTLIELMIVVGIVAILATIAYPSYQSQIRKTRQGDAKAVLMQAAQYMERLYTENGCYDKNPCGTGTATVLPFTKSPIDGAEAFYKISLTTIKANEFMITAKAQSSEGDAKDLSIDHTGTRTNW